MVRPCSPTGTRRRVERTSVTDVDGSETLGLVRESVTPLEELCCGRVDDTKSLTRPVHYNRFRPSPRQLHGVLGTTLGVQGSVSPIWATTLFLYPCVYLGFDVLRRRERTKTNKKILQNNDLFRKIFHIFYRRVSNLLLFRLGTQNGTPGKGDVRKGGSPS